jgi:hypothetical protein
MAENSIARFTLSFIDPELDAEERDQADAQQISGSTSGDE